MDWGMLGYFVGDVVQEHIPVLVGKLRQPDSIRYKHFGAAAASSGGVEMYHIVGVTPEAATVRDGVRRRTRRSRHSATARPSAGRIYDELERERAAIRTSTT